MRISRPQVRLPQSTPSAARTAAPKATPRAATTAPTRDARDFGRFLQDQGRTNSCGTTSLAMLMSFWKNQAGAYNHDKIDASIRHFDGPTAPTNIVSYLRTQGFRAEAKNNASVDDLRKYLDLGVPVQVLYDPSANPKDVYLHYVDVVDYRTDASGKVTALKIADPAGGRLTEVSVEEFQKRWGNLKAMDVDLGVNNLMIVALPKENTQVRGRDGVVRETKDIALPEGGGNWSWQMKVADGVADTANFFGKVGKAVGGFFNKLFG